MAWTGKADLTFLRVWVVKKLNDMGIKAPEDGNWTPNKVSKVVHRRCYTRKHAYNANARVPNPDRPLGDITAEIKRTLVRPKPREEWGSFEVPALVSEELWEKADSNIAERGRGREKQGKTIQSLLRSRIFCPKCGKPMVVRRGGQQNRVYYHCSKYFRPWADNPCSYSKFVPGTWDDLLWADISSWLRNDVWVEQQLVSEQRQDDNTAKLIRLQQFRISQAQAKIIKVREGFEGAIYTLDEARRRIADYQSTIAQAQREIHHLQKTVKPPGFAVANIEALKNELKAIRDRNLEEASFDEKLDIVSKLGIRVYPSEDLKSMRVRCQLNLEQVQLEPTERVTRKTKAKANRGCEPDTWCGKVDHGGAGVTIGRTFELAFSLTI